MRQRREPKWLPFFFAYLNIDSSLIVPATGIGAIHFAAQFPWSENLLSNEYAINTLNERNHVLNTQ